MFLGHVVDADADGDVLDGEALGLEERDVVVGGSTRDLAGHHVGEVADNGSTS